LELHPVRIPGTRSGTRFTMEETFYRKRLEDKFEFEVIIPEAEDRNFVNHVIFNELCIGIKVVLAHPAAS